MTQQIWSDGVRSVEAFLTMIEEHVGTSSTEVATQLLQSAILGNGSFPLYRLARFDSKNLQHAINIMTAVGHYSADFRSDVHRSNRSRLNNLQEQAQ